MLNSFKLFKHQLDYVMCDDKYPFMIGGVGSGKTTAFCIFALNQCAKNAGKTILLAEPTYNRPLNRYCDKQDLIMNILLHLPSTGSIGRMVGVMLLCDQQRII